MTKWILEKKLRVILAGILIVNIPLACLASFIYFSLSHNLEQMRMDENRILAEHIANNIEGRLNSDIAFGKSFATRPRLVDGLRRDDRVEIGIHLKSLIENSKSIERVLIASSKGVLLADYPSVVPSVIGQDHSSKDWFRGISKNWKSCVSEYYLKGAKPQEYSFAIAIPIMAEDNKPLGVIVMQPKNSYIRDAIGNMDIGIGKGLFYIVDNNGYLINHSEYPVDRIIDFSSVPAVTKLLTGTAGAEKFFDPIIKETYLASYQPCNRWGGGVVVQTPSREVFKPFHTLFLGLIIATASMAIMGGFFAYKGAKLLISEKNYSNALNKSKRRYRELIETMNEGFAMQDKNGVLTYVNSRMCEMLGYKCEEIVGQPMSILFDDENLRHFKKQMKLRSEGKEPSYEIVIRHKNGSKLHVLISPHIIIDDEGTYAGSFGVITNITILKNAEKSIRDSEKKLRVLTSSLGEGIYVSDEHGKVSFMNPEAESLLGWTQEELAYKNINDLVYRHKTDGSLLPGVDTPMHNVINTGERYISHDETFIRKNGSSFPVSVISAPVIDNDKVIASVTAFRDITEIKEAQSALNRANQLLELQATTDSLTGIFNRLKFDEMLIKELSRSKRYNIPLSLVMFDIDNFKRINDTFGHHIGDTVLKELTAHISKNIRKHDYFARWGGEEFMILLTHTEIEPAVHFAEHCRIQTEELVIKGIEGITCSYGVTQLRADDDIFSFTKRVDSALYKAKDSGRNRVDKL